MYLCTDRITLPVVIRFALSASLKTRRTLNIYDDGRLRRFVFVSKERIKFVWFSEENNIEVWYIATYMMFNMEKY